ncbi:hypothetical protein GCM10009647_017900 [Streptomyces sanglieri]
MVTGGLPLICAEWPRGAGLWDFLGEVLSDPVSALLVSAERSPAAEFPRQVQARKVLAAIGSGEWTFTSIARAAGGIGATPLQRALELHTGLPSPTNLFQSWRFRVVESTARGSTPPTAPAICRPPGRCERRMSGEVRESVRPRSLTGADVQRWPS